jgi:diguanylate cyclase (GGDEF)-like protein/PAS domain S-box-containing protein
LIGAVSACSIALTRAPGSVSSMWIANGLLLGLVLTATQRLWPAYLAAGAIGSVVARIALGDSAATVVGITATNLFEIAMILWIVRRRVADVTDVAHLRETARTAFFATLATCGISGVFAAAIVTHGGTGHFPSILLTWYVGHVLGIVIAGTLMVVALREGRHLLGRPGRRWKFARTVGLVAAVTLAVFAQTRFPLLFLVFPPLVWAAFRHRFAGVVMGIGSIALIASLATALGSGPIALTTVAGSLERVLLLQFFVGAACLIAMPLVITLTQRSRLAAQVRLNEQRYRLLAENSRDLVVRLRADGRRLYVSPSSYEMLGWRSEEFVDARWDLVHPDDIAGVAGAVATLLRDGVDTTVTYRVRHRDGQWVWIEASARRVPAAEPGEQWEIVYSGRDVSERKQAEMALAEAQQRLRAITDNIPALIAYIDHEHRYRFVNGITGLLYGRTTESILGQHIAQIHGEETYRDVAPHLDAALRGEPAGYTGQSQIGGRTFYFQANYVPDRDESGTVRGVFALTFDITPLKLAELELEKLARFDTLTGLANRRQFEERRDQALIRSSRYKIPIALMSLDVDHFKQINDGLGHAAGDEVLKQFAHRLRACVFDVDLVARLGGDEFVVLIENTGSAEIAELIAQKLLKTMREPIDVAGKPVLVTTSIGIAFCRESPPTGVFMELADRALYAAKAAGRNTYRLVSHPPEE